MQKCCYPKLKNLPLLPRQLVINVASNEYSKVVVWGSLPDGTTVVDCVFLDDGRIVSTYAKRARGLMVRYAAHVKVFGGRRWPHEIKRLFVKK